MSFALFLCATDIVVEIDDSQEDPSDRRYELEQYVYDLTWICDIQINEIAAMIPEREVEKLRNDHYVWKIDRDIQCAKIGRTESGELREFECLAELSEAYFTQRELEISDLESLRDKQKSIK
ncbi:MAG: hypothetical protein IH877_09395 [Gemmatimonadetes bacterium]|nr:hypothetical protein [Gemmatimonadota bacterium]